MARTCGDATSNKMGTCIQRGTHIERRGQGRPKLRWANIFVKESSKKWSKIAKDRREWKTIEKRLVREQNTHIQDQMLSVHQ